MPVAAAVQKLSPVGLRALVQSPIAPQAAQQILDLGLPARDIDRMNLLAAKGREDALNEAETAEMEDLNRLGHLLEMAHSKARKSLKASVA